MMSFVIPRSCSNSRVSVGWRRYFTASFSAGIPQQFARECGLEGIKKMTAEDLQSSNSRVSVGWRPHIAINHHINCGSNSRVSVGWRTVYDIDKDFGISSNSRVSVGWRS